MSFITSVETSALKAFPVCKSQLRIVAFITIKSPKRHISMTNTPCTCMWCCPFNLHMWHSTVGPSLPMPSRPKYFKPLFSGYQSKLSWQFERTCLTCACQLSTGLSFTGSIQGSFLWAWRGGSVRVLALLPDHTRQFTTACKCSSREIWHTWPPQASPQTRNYF